MILFALKVIVCVLVGAAIALPVLGVLTILLTSIFFDGDEEEQQ